MIRTSLVVAALIIISFAILWKIQSHGHIEHHVNPAYESAGFPFSEAVSVDGWVYVSGTIGTSPGGLELASRGIEPETKQTMDNIKATLERQALGMDRIVKCTVMMADMAEWPAFNALYATYFDGNYPARSAFGTTGLALDASVEIECIAKR